MAGVLAGSSFGVLGALGLGVFAVGIGVAAVDSHILVDAFTPTGVYPFIPWCDRRYSYNLATSGSLLANYGLLGAGVAVSIVALIIGRVIGEFM